MRPRIVLGETTWRIPVDGHLARRHHDREAIGRPHRVEIAWVRASVRHGEERLTRAIDPVNPNRLHVIDPGGHPGRVRRPGDEPASSRERRDGLACRIGDEDGFTADVIPRRSKRDIPPVGRPQRSIPASVAAHRVIVWRRVRDPNRVLAIQVGEVHVAVESVGKARRGAGNDRGIHDARPDEHGTAKGKDQQQCGDEEQRQPRRATGPTHFALQEGVEAVVEAWIHVGGSGMRREALERSFVVHRSVSG